MQAVREIAQNILICFEREITSSASWWRHSKCSLGSLIATQDCRTLLSPTLCISMSAQGEIEITLKMRRLPFVVKSG